ncbi:MAG: hypothetical protein FJX56_11280 [Alphaproteobacteria bacterium]|nr:hypothetical protein [Alphaproteobacteria bacterium]
MEYRSLQDIRRIAQVRSASASPRLSRRARLERWAELLERHPERRWQSLFQTEFLPESERRAAGVDGSPLSVAYADPLLQEEGLASDRMGDAIAFFRLSEWDAHRIVCYCHYGRTMPAGVVASQVRSVIRDTSGLRLGGVAALTALAAATTAALA